MIAPEPEAEPGEGEEAGEDADRDGWLDRLRGGHDQRPDDDGEDAGEE